MARPEGMPAPGFLSDSGSGQGVGYTVPDDGITEIYIGRKERPQGMPSPGFLAPSPTAEPGLNAASGQLGKGLAFGYFDEMMGLDAGARGAVADLFGRGDGLSFWQRYEKEKQARDTADLAFEKENPKSAFALQMLGAAAPALVSAGTLPAAAATAKGVLPTVAKTLYGVGMKEIPTVAQLMKMGAAGGALSGAGTAEEGKRLKSAVTHGLVSMVAAPVVGKAVEYGFRGLADLLARKNLVPSMSGLASERGSMSFRKSKAPEYSPEELMLAKQLKNTPIKNVENAANEMNALAGDAPLFLPEAVNSAKVDRNARFVANQEASMEFAQEAIKDRARNAPTRASAAFDAVAPNTGDGVERIAKAGGTILDDAQQARQELVEPLYKEAYERVPVVVSDDLNGLIESDKVLQRAITEVKKTANNASLPDNSTQILVKARNEISNQIERAQSQGLGRKARDLTDTYKRLNKILHRSSTKLKEADAVYATASQSLDELQSTFLTRLSKMTGDKTKNIGQVLELPAESISKLRERFEAAGLIDEWNLGMRAHVQSVVNKTQEGRNFVTKLIGTTDKERRLQAALGDAYPEVKKALDLEHRMFEGKNRYNAGSSTHGNIEEGKAFEKNVGILNSMLSKDWRGTLTKLFGGDMSDEVAQGLAKIYFDPATGRGSIEKVLPLLRQYAKNKNFSELLAKTTGAPGSRAVLGKGDRADKGVNRGARSAVSTSKNPPLRPGAARSGDSAGVLSPRKSGPAKQVRQSQTKSSANPRTSEKVVNSAIDRAEAKISPYSERLKPMTNTPAKIKRVEAKIDADPLDKTIYEIESSRNPEAKNPDSSAAGAFQLIKSIAKNLGVRDALDIEDNYNGYLKLKDEYRETLNRVVGKKWEPEDFYAVHYLGAPTFTKWKKGRSLSPKQAEQVEYLTETVLPKFRKKYAKNASGSVRA